MAEMTVQQTIEYLKQVSMLETSIYKQKEVKEEATRVLIKPDIERAEPLKKPTYREPCQPSEPSLIEDLQLDCLGGLIFAGVCALIGVIGFFHSVFTGLLGLGMGAAVLVGCLLKVLPDYLFNKKDYPARLERYMKDCTEGKQKYKQELQEYNEAVAAAEAQYNTEVTTAWCAYHAAAKEISKLDKPIQETQSLLARIYAADVIFPKYRNMVAMCTIYEYFASGRCTELTGANGAYNLFESEQRQNLIISQLEAVNANLEQVKQNQFILYQGIAETNQILKGVSADIKGILSMTTDIAVSSRITAFCAQVTAVNAQAQTYLAIMD